MENQQWWNQIIDFKPFELGAMLSVTGGVIWFFINRRYQNKDNLKATRLDTYKSFLNKLDEAGSSSRVMSGEIMRIMSEVGEKILKDHENSNDVLIEMNHELSSLTKESLKGFQIFTNEINQLTLVCSKKMLPLVEELLAIYKQVSNNYTSLLSNLNFLDPAAQDKLQSILSKSDQDRLIYLNAEIKNLMRKEIGNEQPMEKI